MQTIVKRVAFIMMIVLAIVMAGATVVEKLYGTAFAVTKVYGAWWFVVLWAILALAAAVYIVQQKLYREPASFLLHGALVVILAGALITYLTADRGYMHIRQGQIHNYYISESDNARHKLPFDVKLLLFEIEYHPENDQPADFISYLKIDDEVQQVSMNKIYKQDGFRLYQLEYDDDEMGTTLLVNHDPWGIGTTYTGYLLLLIAAVWLLFKRISWRGVVPLTLVTAAVWAFISQIKPMTPVLRSPMLAAHVSIIMMAYALLVVIAVLSVVALCSKKRAEKLYRLNSKLLYPALFFLAIGIFIGAVWANISWGRYWGWDSKETWALITFFIYALPMHKRSLTFFSNPKTFHRYCAFAILSVAMTFLGVSFLLGGMHSYL